MKINQQNYVYKIYVYTFTVAARGGGMMFSAVVDVETFFRMQLMTGEDTTPRRNRVVGRFEFQPFPSMADDAIKITGNMGNRSTYAGITKRSI